MSIPLSAPAACAVRSQAAPERTGSLTGMLMQEVQRQDVQLHELYPVSVGEGLWE